MAQMSDGKSDGKSDKSADHKPVQETKLPQTDDILQPLSIDQVKEKLLYVWPDVENRVVESDNTVVDRPCRTPSDGDNDKSCSTEPVEHEELDYVDLPGAEAGNGLKLESDSTIEDEYLKSGKGFDEKGIPVEHFPLQTQSEPCPSESCSNCSSSVDLKMMLPVSYSNCEICQVIKMKCRSQETLEFWEAVPETSDPTSGCHKKFYSKFHDLLKQTYPKEPGMKNTRITNLLKRLLRIPDTESTACVSLENVVRLVRLFGPIKAEGVRCVLIQQLQKLSENSLRYTDEKKKERRSWFAGEMSREEAEQRLQKESDNTYLIRISGTNDGDFALSVKHNSTIYHFEIKGQPEKAATTNPFSAKLLFKEEEYDNLVQIAEELSYKAITPHDESDSQIHIWCRIICPGLPLNGIIKGYRKAKKV